MQPTILKRLLEGCSYAHPVTCCPEMKGTFSRVALSSVLYILIKLCKRLRLVDITAQITTHHKFSPGYRYWLRVFDWFLHSLFELQDGRMYNCKQFPHPNETIRQDNKIRGSTPFNKDVNSGRYGAVRDRNKSWIPLKPYYSRTQFFSWISSLSSTWTNKKKCCWRLHVHVHVTGIYQLLRTSSWLLRNYHGIVPDEAVGTIIRRGIF